MANHITDLRTFNSTTYADILGLQLGIDRLPGERSVDYLHRLTEAASLRRDHTPEGTLSEIAIRLGLGLTPAISITSSDPNATVKCNMSEVTLISNGVTVTCPIVTIDEDEFWTWKKLSDVVEAINLAGTTYEAKLLVRDAPALQIASQSNVAYNEDQSTTITWPFEIVTSEVGLVSLVDPGLAGIAVSTEGNLAYQLREVLQTIMAEDRSYWTK
jgi:hypothetical protein